MARSRKKHHQVDLEEQILIEEHELGQHGEDVPDCPLCEAEEEIDPKAPRPELPQKRTSKSKGSTSESSLIINNIDVIADLRAGVKPGEMARRVGMKRNQLRRRINKMFGENFYQTLRQSTGSPDRNGRESRRREEAPIRSLAKLDRGVTKIPSARIQDGWSFKTVFVNYGGKRLRNLPPDVPHDPSVAETVMISPEGQRYVLARLNESADLIVRDAAQAVGLDPIRLRTFETSSIYHLVKENEELIKRGEESLARSRETKKKNRVRRKGGLA